jgi:uncharacterized damage-inducible protein DinB
MMEDVLFDALARGREHLLKQVGDCPLDKRYVVPTGFNNNILWQLGHIVTETDGLITRLSGEKQTLSAEYKTFFVNGTKPSEWNGEPPPWDEILSQLKDQIPLIRRIFIGKLDTRSMDNPSRDETVEELLLFNLFHEYLHIGNIGAMLKVLGVK